jgi:hypothetical protein
MDHTCAGCKLPILRNALAKGAIGNQSRMGSNNPERGPIGRRLWAAALVMLMLSACSANMSVAPARVEKQPARPEAGDAYLNLLRDRVVKYLPKQGEDSSERTATVTYIVGLYRDGRLASVQVARHSGDDRPVMIGESAIRRALLMPPMLPVPDDYPGNPVVYFTARLSVPPL